MSQNTPKGRGKVVTSYHQESLNVLILKFEDMQGKTIKRYIAHTPNVIDSIHDAGLAVLILLIIT